MPRPDQEFDGMCSTCRVGTVNPEHERCWHEADAARRVRSYFTEDDVREAIRRERDRWGATVTHPDAEDEVLARLREMQAEREASQGTT